MASPELIAKAVKKYKRYKLSPRAALVADFIETYCTYSKGKDVAQPFRILKWQFKVLRGMYPGKPGDKRVITRVLVSIARKNGKTEFASALVVVHLCGPEAGYGEQIVCAAAASERQASFVWEGAKQMLLNHPIFKAKYSQAHSTRHDGATILKDSIVWEPRKNYAITIGTKSSSAQGLIPSFWTYDEVAEATDRKHYEALNLADKASNGLGFIISTRSTNPASLFTILYDEAVIGQANGINKHWYIQVHSADPKSSNLFTKAQVKKANPAVGEILDPEDLWQLLDNAKANPSARPEFRARILNIESGEADSLVDPGVWAEAGIPWVPEDELHARMNGKPVIMSIDLGSTTSMTSLALYWPTEGLVSVKNWMAKVQVEHNEMIHKAPYRAWADAGYLTLIDAEVNGGMTYEPIARHIGLCMKRFDVKSLRYDGWNSGRLFEALKEIGLDYEKYPLKGILDQFIQGMKSYGEAITEFEDKMLNGNLRHDSNPVTTMSVNVCQVESKNRATEDLKVPAKNKQQLPNDAAVAIIMAQVSRGVKIDVGSVTDSLLDAWYSDEDPDFEEEDDEDDLFADVEDEEDGILA